MGTWRESGVLGADWLAVQVQLVLLSGAGLLGARRGGSGLGQIRSKPNLPLSGWMTMGGLPDLVKPRFHPSSDVNSGQTCTSQGCFQRKLANAVIQVTC